MLKENILWSKHFSSIFSLYQQGCSGCTLYFNNEFVSEKNFHTLLYFYLFTLWYLLIFGD